MRVLVCGGAGYIGSHAVLSLAERGHGVVVLDNFSNSSPQVLERLATLLGAPVACERADVRDFSAVRECLRRHRIEAVMHFAGLKAVGESCAQPLIYFDNNITGTITLMRAMHELGVQHLVFSSSATVYGQPERNPITEDAPLRVANPYGRTKQVIEDLIRDASSAHAGFHAVLLRYFNPVGAHPSGLIGESALGTPNNLMPYLCQVAVGQRDFLPIYGNDYPTRDGTGVRDYLHVMDLARAHADALAYLQAGKPTLTVNLGTGTGHSVLEVLQAFESVCGRRIPYRILDRRPGDVAEYYADPSFAQRALAWRAKHDLRQMCADAWRWQSSNPQGFGSDVV